MSDDDALTKAVLDFFTCPVHLPSAPATVRVGDKWFERDDGWLLPWRITRNDETGVHGYPCGEPVRQAGVAAKEPSA